MNKFNLPNILEILNTFAEKCISDEFPCSKYIKQACKRHQKDLQRDDIYFDEKKALRAVLFIEMMVHVKGSFAGKRLKLEEWQIFIVGSVFGWMRHSNDLRRYSEVNVFIPRKNGKTLLGVAIDLYMLVEDGEFGAEIILAASKEDQAKELFEIARAMVSMNPALQSHYGITMTTEIIKQSKTNSFFKYVIGRPKDGGNTSNAHIDEAHEHKDGSAADSLKNGMGAREQPILWTWSTAGNDVSSYYHRYCDYCKEILEDNNDKEDDSLFIMLFTVDDTDDWKDFNVWKKANPNMNVSIKESFLLQQYNVALNDASRRSDILTKHLNVWNNESLAWIDMQKWRACGDPSLKIEDFEGEDCWLGVDLASRIDLCSIGIVFKKGDEYVMFSQNYHNSQHVHSADKKWKPYQVWEQQGWLTVTEGAYTDFSRVEEDLKDLDSKFNIMELGYDPHESTFLMQNVREWADFDVIEIRQNPTNISEPMKIMEQLYMAGKLKHNNNPILDFAAQNVVKKNINSKTYFPTKKTNDQKIDPIVALIMAVQRASLAPEESNIVVFGL